MKKNNFSLDFFKTEAGAGTVLALSALISIVWANSPWALGYQALISQPVSFPVLNSLETLSLKDFVKEGLMAIFFFIVGLEIKYEIVRGELSSVRKLALPVMAALGGIAVPALIYTALNHNGDMRGWAVPVATDIAFAVAVLAMAGRHLPSSLRIFLLTLAIVDDLGAVIIIGVFYGSGYDLGLMAAIAGVALMMCAAHHVIKKPLWMLMLVYSVLFYLIWSLSLKAHLSTSIAGVLAAFCIPLSDRKDGGGNLLQLIMHTLHPYVAYGILPLFALVASGLSLSGVMDKAVLDLRYWGVVLGLVIGKPMGICLLVWLCLRLKLGHMPKGAGPVHIFGVSLLCAIGFTMSLFIGGLAFPDDADTAHKIVKFGTFSGSLCAAFAGALYLSRLKATPLNGK
jgi:Na+:H+ antiporter, NhaA family